MATPSSQIAAAWTKSALQNTEWVPLRDVCFAAVSANWGGKSESELWEYVEENVAFVAEYLRREAAEWKVDGTVPRFEIDAEPSPYIRALTSYASKVLIKLREADPFRVEELCAEILKKLGANSFKTQSTGDGGVDFVGTHMNIVAKGLSVPDACKAIVLGQTKRYKDGNTINETKMRDFVGGAVLRRHLMQKDGTAGPLTPFIFAFWTTSDFDPNAKRFARESGLWYMDGYTFANYINELGLAGALM